MCFSCITLFFALEVSVLNTAMGNEKIPSSTLYQEFYLQFYFLHTEKYSLAHAGTTKSTVNGFHPA